MQLATRPRYLGDATAGATDSGFSFATFLPQLLTGAAAVYTQQQLLDYNRDAASKGLPLLSTAQMQSMMQGAQPGVNIGVSQDVKQIATYALLGAGALALFYTFMRRAR